MIDLRMPGGIYDPPRKRDVSELDKSVEMMNELFAEQQKAGASDLPPQQQEVKKETKVPKKEEKTPDVVAPNPEDEKNVLIDNLKGDIDNITADLTAAIKLIADSGNNKELEALKAENEDLKKRLADAEEKAKKFDALKSIIG